MKTLLIMRHGHAQDHSDQGDFGRALSDKGRMQVKLSAQFLQDILPEQLYVSTARRTQMTADIIAKTYDIADKRHDDDKLYLATVGDLLVYINHLPDCYNRLMFIGHNPGIYELCALLHDHKYDQSLPLGFPTAAVAKLSLPVHSWKDVVPQCGALDTICVSR